MKKKITEYVLYALSALLLVGGILMLLRQYVLMPGTYTPPTVTPAPTATPLPTAAPQAEAAAAPSPSPTPYVKVAPTRIYFTKAEVMADIFPVGIITEGERAGQMDTIDDPDVAAWYEPGAAPGGPGNALINGHKSWKGKLGRFSVLWDMQVGDEVIIEYADGSLAAFYAVSVDLYPYDGVPASVMELEGESRVTLITCHGEFDRNAGTSEERCVVVLRQQGEAHS